MNDVINRDGVEVQGIDEVVQSIRGLETGKNMSFNIKPLLLYYNYY